MTTYEKVSAILMEKGISIHAAEKGAGLGNAVIAGWGKAKNGGRPSGQSLKRLAAFLDVPIESLIGDDQC